MEGFQLTDKIALRMQRFDKIKYYEMYYDKKLLVGFLCFDIMKSEGKNLTDGFEIFFHLIPTEIRQRCKHIYTSHYILSLYHREYVEKWGGVNSFIKQPSIAHTIEYTPAILMPISDLSKSQLALATPMDLTKDNLLIPDKREFWENLKLLTEQINNTLK